MRPEDQQFKSVVPIDVDLLRREFIKLLQMMDGLHELGLTAKRCSGSVTWDQLNGFHIHCHAAEFKTDDDSI